MADETPRTDAEAAAELAAMFPALDAWRVRLRTPLIPDTGSPLAADDEAWSPSPLSALAVTKLSTAVDRLQAIRVLCEAKSYHPTATYTLTRSALLAASEALWLLGPAESALRQSRGLWVARNAAEEHVKYLRAIKDGPGVLWARLGIVRGHLAMRRRGIELRRGELPPPGKTTNTDVVEWSAQHLQPHQPEWVAQALGLWREGSGNAHGFQYAAIQGLPEQSPPSSGDGLYAFQVGGSPLKTWRHYYVAAMTLGRAWQRWDELASTTKRTT